MHNTQNNQADFKMNAFGDAYIDLINETHFAANSAKAIYTKILKEHLNQPDTLYVVIGTDSGLFPEHLNKLSLPNQSKFLFIELDLVLPLISSQITQQLKNIFIASPQNWEKSAEDAKLNDFIYNDKVKIFQSLAATEGHIEDYTELFQVVKQKLESIHHEKISITNHKHFLEQQLLNTVDNLLPAKLLENTAKGQAIIVGAGPSLNEHINWLKEQQDKITIIAVSRTYQLLKQHDITPDIITSSDPFGINYEQSKAFLADDDVIFVHSNHVNYRLPAQWKGLSFYRDKLYPWETGKNPDNVENDGPTVTHASLALAIEMGFEDIYLTGVDLCFKPDGTTHADGQILQEENSSQPVVINYDNEQVLTDSNLLLGIKHLAEIAKRHTGNIYNLSSKAAKVAGISVAPYPDDLTEKWQLRDIKKPTEDDRQQHLNRVNQEIKKARNAYSEIIKLCKEALQLNDKAFKENEFNKSEKHKFKLDKLEKKLTTKYAEYTHLAQLVASRDFLRLLIKGNQQRNAQQEHDWLEIYYNSYIQGAYEILKSIKLSQEYLDFRLLEITEKNLDHLIFNFWHDWGLHGRSCLALKTGKISNEISASPNMLCSVFQNYISDNSMSSK